MTPRPENSSAASFDEQMLDSDRDGAYVFAFAVKRAADEDRIIQAGADGPHIGNKLLENAFSLKEHPIQNDPVRRYSLQGQEHRLDPGPRKSPGGDRTGPGRPASVPVDDRNG